MLLKALTIASLATLAVAAPTGTTCNFQRISPKPKGTTCQNTQALKNPLGAALIQRYTVPESVANPYVQCGTTCSTTSGCLSFAYRADLRGCRLYNKTLKNAGLVAGSIATGIASDDMACFKKVCTTPVTPTSSSTSTTPVTPTCTTSRVSPTVSLPNPTTLVAPNQDSAVYNPEATLNIPWTFQMFGQSFSSFDMNQFGQLTATQGGYGTINTLGSLSQGYIPAGTDGGFFSEIDGELGQRILTAQWKVTDYAGSQHSPPLLYNWIAQFYEADPTLVTFDYYSVPAIPSYRWSPYVSWAVYSGGGGTSGGLILHDEVDYVYNDDLTNTILTYDAVAGTITALTTVGPAGCVAMVTTST